MANVSGGELLDFHEVNGEMGFNNALSIRVS